MHEGFEASLSQRGLLTASLRPNNDISYVNTKENLTRSQESEYFTTSMRSITSAKSNASVPYNFKKEPVIAHEPYDLLMSHGSQSSPIIAHEPYDLLMPHGSLSSLSTLVTSNEVTKFAISMRWNSYSSYESRVTTRN